jgi:predicted RNA-binding Zn-ribbon protein involved in translation (DUF1610 family)
MTENSLKCSSCGKNVSNEQGAVNMDCPNCSKAKIIRCKECRKIAAKYKCPECGFEGPN